MRSRLVTYWCLAVLLLSLGAFFLHEPPSALAARTVRVGISPAAPLVDNSGEKPEGLFIDLIEYFAVSLDWRVEYVDRPWSELLVDLERGDIDLLPAIAATDERERVFDYSRDPVFVDSGVLFAGRGFDLRTIFDLQGARVASVRDSVYTQAFEAYAASFGVVCEIVLVSDNPAVMQAIADGMVDAGISIYSLGSLLSREYPVDITAISFSPLVLGFAVPEGKNPDIIAGIDRLTAPMLDDPDSVYSRSFKRWISPEPSGSIPGWVWWGIAGACVAAALFGGWTVLLRRQAAARMKHLVAEVSERKRAEEELRKSQAELRQVHRLARLGVWSWDPATDTVTWNEELFSISGRSPQGGAPSFKEHPSLWTPESWARLQAAVEEALKTGDPYNLDLEMLRPNGERRVINAWGGAKLDDDGKVVRLHGTVQDMTERVQAEEAVKAAEGALRERDEQLRQSQKMEAVGQLAGGIAHDFNNLLTAIIGYADLVLSSREIADSAARADVEEIRRAAERAGALTRQILAFSRRQALRPDVVSLNEVLTGMTPLLSRTLGENIDLVGLQCPDLGHTEIDVHQFEQVLMNLALNARDAMPAGGSLTLETANVELSAEYCLTRPGTTPGSYVMLAVSDTGTGMDEATLEHVFEPFFTTKAPGEGTGLGLATVYGIVKQSHGNITVYSEPGKGTSFKIYLPRVEAHETQEVLFVPEHDPTSGSETVMVVEDESSLRGLIERVLGGAGYQVISFGSADEAAEALERDEVAPDLLLTDLVLPGVLQGKGLADLVRVSRPDMAILFMSGYTRNAIVHAGRLDEGLNFLEKPFTPVALVRAVRQVLDALDSTTPEGA